MTSTTPTPLADRADKLKDFDSLPDCAYVRVDIVSALFGCSVPTIWNWTKSGKIPKPRKLSPGHTAWKVSDLRAVLGAAK